MINLLLLLLWIGFCGISASFINDIVNYAKKKIDIINILQFRNSIITENSINKIAKAA
tara:strand:+ start:75 stop:248 length:174 start_codon:yes stop_codon:yes gene_type:complete